MTIPALSKYVAASFAYGAISTHIKIRSASIYSYDKDLSKVKRPLLFTEHVAACALGGCSAIYPFGLVYSMYRDACTFEKYVRGLPSDVTPKAHACLFDAVFD